MKKFNFIFSIHTPVIICLSLISSYISLYFHLVLYIDFIIVSVIIAFPISFTMREAFRRREKALEYISLFKASLQSLFYCFESSDLDKNKKSEIRNILANTSTELIRYLSDKGGNHKSVQEVSNRAYLFIQENEENLKKSFSVKILLFMFRINESLTFLMATKRHQTPWAIRLIILLGVYLFVVFYPASLLSRTGFQVSLGYVFVMTCFKGIIFICLYNIQNFLVDPFNQTGADGVKLEDFEFTGLPYLPQISVNFENAIMEESISEAPPLVQTNETIARSDEKTT
jgi:hypothetical protein